MDLMNLSPDAVALIGFIALFTLMLLRVPVGMAMGLVGVCGYSYIVGSGPALKLIGQTSMRTVTDYTFGVIPMFMLMGALSCSAASDPPADPGTAAAPTPSAHTLTWPCSCMAGMAPGRR